MILEKFPFRKNVIGLPLSFSTAAQEMAGGAQRNKATDFSKLVAGRPAHRRETILGPALLRPEDSEPTSAF